MDIERVNMKFIDFFTTKLNGVKGKRLGLVVGLALMLDAFSGMGFVVSLDVKWPVAVLCLGYMFSEAYVDAVKVNKGGIPPTGTGTAPKQ